jgi:hypothetical protein
MLKQQKVKRDYRNLSPGKAFVFFGRVKRCLNGNENFPDATWGAHTTPRKVLFEAIDRHEVAYHLAANGDRLLIAARDKIQQEIVDMLDEVASHLEAVSVRNPEALLSSGFNVVQERRASNRTRLPLAASTDFNVSNAGRLGSAIGFSSDIPGAYNHEIHINYKDPSQEQDWLHKDIFPNPSEMIMTGLNSGNVFFRERPHGPNGPGPWSATVTLFIT